MNQVLPYLPLAAKDATLRRLLRGLVRRQAFYVALDPHANAFTQRATDASPNSGDATSVPSFLGTTRSGMGPCCSDADGYALSDVDCRDALVVTDALIANL